MLGFRAQPTDHYRRTVYLARRQDLCYGSVADHVTVFDWIRDFVHVYPDTQPKFSFVFHGALSHDSMTKVRVADADLRDLLRDLHADGSLNRTLLIIMSDHGSRHGAERSVEQGKYEERNPYFGVRIPTWLARSHPAIVDNLRRNADRLTTPFDIHATFKELLNFSGSGPGDRRRRGISLFKEIPAGRTCADAAIEPHWCNCLQWTSISVDNEAAMKVVAAVVSFINNLTVEQRDVCSELTVDAVLSAGRYGANGDLLRFKQSADADGRVPLMADAKDAAAAATEFLYQVKFVVRPSGGIFEATVGSSTNVVGDGKSSTRYALSGKEISRLNVYGRQPHCVMDRLPHLRPYCYCMVPAAYDDLKPALPEPI